MPIYGGDAQLAALSGAKGFLDLPGEIRNTIYNIICDNSFWDHQKWSGARKLSIGIKSEAGSRPLAIVGVCEQITREFVTLLLHRHEPTEAVRWLQNDNPPTLNILTSMNILQAPDATDSKRTKNYLSSKILKCSFAMQYYDTRSKYAVFTLDFPGSYDLTPASKDSIKSTLLCLIDRVECFAIDICLAVMDQLMALKLTASYKQSDASMYYQHTVIELKLSCNYRDGAPGIREHRHRV